MAPAARSWLTPRPLAASRTSLSALSPLPRPAALLAAGAASPGRCMAASSSAVLGRPRALPRARPLEAVSSVMLVIVNHLDACNSLKASTNSLCDIDKLASGNGTTGAAAAACIGCIAADFLTIRRGKTARRREKEGSPRRSSINSCVVAAKVFPLKGRKHRWVGFPRMVKKALFWVVIIIM